MTIFKNRFKLSLLAATLTAPMITSAQDVEGMDSSTLLLTVIVIVFIVSLLVLAVAGYTLQILKVFVRRAEEKKAAEKGVEYVPEPSMWSKFMASMTDSVPVEKEEAVLLDHDYDGIHELDNHLPPWWKYLFYFTIAWGIVYFFAYHVFDAFPLSEEEYRQEIAAAEAVKAANLASMDIPEIDESSVTATTDAAELMDGEKIYQMQCAACHKPDGGGSIGPNLTDQYWIHGGSMVDVFKTIKVGVPEKGMIAWEAVLNPVQMRNVASYVLTLQGTNPPNAKAPQGDLFEESQETETPAEEASEAEESTEDTEVTEVTQASAD